MGQASSFALHSLPFTAVHCLRRQSGVECFGSVNPYEPPKSESQTAQNPLFAPSPTDKADSEGFGVVMFLTLLFWPLGLIATLVYFFAGRIAHSFLILCVTLATGAFTCALWKQFYGRLPWEIF